MGVKLTIVYTFSTLPILFELGLFLQHYSPYQKFKTTYENGVIYQYYIILIYPSFEIASYLLHRH